jgi:hypothetical protein
MVTGQVLRCCDRPAGTRDVWTVAFGTPPMGSAHRLIAGTGPTGSGGVPSLSGQARAFHPVVTSSTSLKAAPLLAPSLGVAHNRGLCRCSSLTVDRPEPHASRSAIGQDTAPTGNRSFNEGGSILPRTATAEAGACQHSMQAIEHWLTPISNRRRGCCSIRRECR